MSNAVICSECLCLFSLLILVCVCLTVVQLSQDDTFLPTSFLSTADVQVGSQLSGLLPNNPDIPTCVSNAWDFTSFVH